MIRPVRPEDAEAIVSIYNYYVEHSTATFEESPLTTDDMLIRIKDNLEQKLPWIVAEQDGQIFGYAYGRGWNARSAYRFSVESSVYLNKDFTGSGWGTRLYNALFPLLRERGIHLVISGVTLPNDASVALHEKLGMKKVGQFKEIGFKKETWLDVGYWQMKL